LPLVVSLHGSDVYVAETLGPARRAARAVFRRAGVVTACSSDLGRRAVALGADPARIVVVPYGVDVERFRPDAERRACLRHRLGVTDNTSVILAAGRLVRKKGFEYLIDAMGILRQHPDMVMVLAGDGDLRNELEARAASAGIPDRVRFLGNQSQDEVAGWLTAADVVVVPSVRDDSGNVDGLPNIVMEALASGTPLIATPAGGIGAIVQNDRTGVIVSERDAQALAAAVRALASDTSRRRRIGEAARQMAASRFCWAETARQIEGAYEHALAIKSVAS
jgi:glycosyltransferase involved in cell wall biosynthesis